MFRRLTRTQLVIDIVVAGLFALVALPFDLSIGRFNDNNALGTVLVALLMGGLSAEREVSLSSARECGAALERLKMCADCRVIDIYSATDEVQIDAVADGRNIQGWRP